MTPSHLTDCAGADGDARPGGASWALPDERADADCSDLPDLDFVEREGARAEAVEVAERGWIGLADQHCMTALIPTPGQPYAAVTRYAANANVFQIEARTPAVTARLYRRMTTPLSPCTSLAPRRRT